MYFPKLMFVLSLVILSGFSVFAQDEDSEGCKDYPAFNRMPGFFISYCEEKDFDAYPFVVENSDEEDAKAETVEGKFFEINYVLGEDQKSQSALQIFRNFENALKKSNATIVGKVVESGNSYSFLNAKVKKGNTVIWISLHANDNEYNLVIVEKEEMKQVIKADEMLEALNNDGYIALNILFATNKAVIEPESEEIVDQIYQMLKNNASLKVSIEGHTDNTGKAAGNKTLSENRAKTVMETLVSKGIDKTRLSSKGWGQEVPVADNRTEEGRAKNRRVEIVKK